MGRVGRDGASAAEHNGLEQQTPELERAAPGEWESLAVAMLAEAVAALLLEVRPTTGRSR